MPLIFLALFLLFIELAVLFACMSYLELVGPSDDADLIDLRLLNCWNASVK